MALESNKYRLVIPGELLISGRYKIGRGVHRRKDNENFNYYSTVVGLATLKGNMVSVVPLEGGYHPYEGDTIIGKIITVGVTSWIVDIRGPYPAVLSVNNVVDRDRPFDPMRESLKRIMNMDIFLMPILVTRLEAIRDSHSSNRNDRKPAMATAPISA